MKPVAFDYVRATSVDEAVALLARHGSDARILAGGQSLVPLMNFRLARPSVLIDGRAVAGLAGIREHDGGLAIGAMTRQSELEDSALAGERCPLLGEATKCIGHRTVRNQGTVGGSVAHADPSAELPTVMVALDGQVTARSGSGERVIDAHDLFVANCTTSLEPDELLTEVRIPALPAGAGWAFEELTRRHGDWAMVGVAAVLGVDGEGRCSEARIALGGVDIKPVRCREAEAALLGKPASDDRLLAACRACEAVADPTDDIHGDAAYKRAMVGVFAERALRKALSRARRA